MKLTKEDVFALLEEFGEKGRINGYGEVGVKRWMRVGWWVGNKKTPKLMFRSKLFIQ